MFPGKFHCPLGEGPYFRHQQVLTSAFAVSVACGQMCCYLDRRANKTSVLDVDSSFTIVSCFGSNFPDRFDPVPHLSLDAALRMILAAERLAEAGLSWQQTLLVM